MDIPKLIILLCCAYRSLASDHSHTIPIEHYETELQDLGQHVEIPKTPVKVIKITKTIAVKIPVPYPVKVKEKVPYPVHVSKPYPVPVPQIVHVPHIVHAKAKAHHEHGASDGGHDSYQATQHGGNDGQSYQVQETPSYEHSFLPQLSSYNGNSDHEQSYGPIGEEHNSSEGDGNSYDAPNSYYGYSADGDGKDSVESKSYDQAIKDYLKNHNAGGNSGNSGYHYP